MAYNENPDYLKLSGGTMTGTLTLNGDPSDANDAANKSYVDALSAGLTFKTSVVCATTSNLNGAYLNGTLGVGATLTNVGTLAAFTVDGITPTINQRVLVKNQTSQFQNGIYTITTLGTGAVAWILTRATDYDQVAEINPGDIIPVSTGTVQANTSWLQTGFVSTMGTSLITFQQYQSTPIQTTQYNILTGGASNTVNSVAPSSTSGVPVISQGSSSQPVFGTAAVAGGGTGSTTASGARTNLGVPALAGNKTLLSTQAASTSTELDFTGVTGYARYVLEFFEVILSHSTDNLAIQLSTDNGSNYSATGYTQSGYAGTAGAALSGYNGASATYFSLAQSVGTAAADAANGTVTFYCFANASLNKNILANTGYTNSVPTLYQVQTSGKWATTTVVNALRVLVVGTGNIVSGTFNLYGIT